jgi:hypothetical protein
VGVSIELVLTLGILLQGTLASPEESPRASIRGSPQSMQEQHRVALEHGLPFFRTEAEILEAVERGLLVELPGNADYEVADFVTLPYLTAEGRLFVERTAALYREACGQALVVTSAVRAIEEQPPNAHPLSVHPAGMAVDLRVSPVPECRQWLESKFLTLEEQGILNGIRERRPPHYHVAVYPTAYRAYVESRRGPDVTPGPPAAPLRPTLGWARVLLLLATLAVVFALMNLRMRKR